MNKIRALTYNWLTVKINNNSFVDNKEYIKGRVIDLGCGKAPYKEDILETAREYFGVDWEDTYHDQSQIDIYCNLSSPLPFKADCVDTVVSFQVMEHLAEPSLFLSECCRVLRSGGHFFATVPFMWHVHEAPFDYFRYTRHGLEYLLVKNGFELVHITETTGFWQMAAMKFNYQSTRVAKGPLKYFLIPLWWLTQVISPVLDRHMPCPQETASYAVVARKL